LSNPYQHDANDILKHADRRFDVHLQILWDSTFNLVQHRWLITALAHKMTSTPTLGLIQTVITEEVPTSGEGKTEIGLGHLQSSISLLV